MNKELTDKIEAYLEHQLAGEDLLAFEAELNANASVKKEFEAHKAVQEVIIDHELMALKGKIKDFLDTKTPRKPGKNPWGQTALMVSGIVAVSLSAWLLIGNDNDHSLDHSQNKIEIENPIFSSEELIHHEKQDEPGLDQKKSIDEPQVIISNEKKEEKSLDNKNFKEREGTDKKALTPLSPLPMGNSVLEGIDVRLMSEIIKPIPIEVVSSGIHEECAWIQFSHELKVIDECQAGSIYLPLTWVNKSTNDEMSILLLPDSIQLKDHFIMHVKSGSYELWVNDNNGCQFTTTLEILGKACHREPRVFSPDKGETIAFELPKNESGEIKIFNRNGMLIKKMSFSPGQQIFWNGHSDSGNLISMGAYFFIATTYEGIEIAREVIHVLR